jgi:hypothetical protein
MISFGLPMNIASKEETVMIRWMSVAAIAVGSVFAIGCGQSATAPSSTVSSVTVTGSVPTVGATSQFTATATLADGTTQDVTMQATWQTSNSADATVSATGVVTGIATGTVAVQATYQSVTGIDQIAIGS